MALLSRTRACAWLALGPLLLAGCLREETIAPIRDSIAVHAVASVGASTIGVALSEVSSSGEAVPLNGATVRIVREPGAVTLVASGSASSYCFAGEVNVSEAQCYGGAIGAPVGAGETIGLEIELPDGTRIAGSTTTPAPPVVEQPLADSEVEVVFVLDRFEYGFSLESEPIEVRWSGTADRPGGVSLELFRLFDDGVEVNCGEFFEVDGDAYTRSPVFIDPPFDCAFDPEDPAWDSAHVQVHVAAYDASLVAYLSATDESSEGLVGDAASPGLQVVSGDALLVGVFGSSARATVPFRLRAVVVDRRTEVSGSRASGAPAPSGAAP